jgi:hypothetical protein
VRSRRGPRPTTARPFPQLRNAPPRQTQPAAGRMFSRTLAATNPARRRPQSAGSAPRPQTAAGPARRQTQIASEPPFRPTQTWADRMLPQTRSARSLVFLRTQTAADSARRRTQTQRGPPAQNALVPVLPWTRVADDPALPRAQTGAYRILLPNASHGLKLAVSGRPGVRWRPHDLYSPHVRFAHPGRQRQLFGYPHRSAPRLREARADHGSWAYRSGPEAHPSRPRPASPLRPGGHCHRPCAYASRSRHRAALSRRRPGPSTRDRPRSRPLAPG